MRLLSLVLLTLLLSNGSAFLAQASRQDGPPPPSSEYFLQQWVQFKSEAGKFTIKFPKTPREYTEMQNDEGGAQATVYIAEHKGLLLYVATYGDTVARLSDAKEFLNGISEAWLSANSARNLHVIKNEDTSVAGFPARYLQVETQRDVVRVRWIVVKQRIYYQFVAAPKHQNAMESENGYEKLAMGFFNSFQLTK